MQSTSRRTRSAECASSLGAASASLTVRSRAHSRLPPTRSRLSLSSSPEKCVSPSSSPCSRHSQPPSAQSDSFQSDIYPPAPSAEPALTAAEFFAGKTAPPKLVSLEDGAISSGTAPLSLPPQQQQVAAPPPVTKTLSASAPAPAPAPVPAAAPVSAPVTPAASAPARQLSTDVSAYVLRFVTSTC